VSGELPTAATEVAGVAYGADESSHQPSPVATGSLKTGEVGPSESFLPPSGRSSECETGRVNHVIQAGVLGDLPARDFLVSPGFAGVAALLAAIIVSGAVLFAVRRAGKRSQQALEQRDHDLAQVRAEAEHSQAIARCWERWQWVVDKAGVEPALSEGASLGLGPAVTLELLRGLLRDAEALGDDTLAKAVAVYQEQVLLVLAQQAGPVAGISGAATVKLPAAKSAPAPTPHRKPEQAPPFADASVDSVDEAPSDAEPKPAGGRRRR
jgi:hypothetical protein